MAILHIDKEQIEQNNLGGVRIRRRYRAGSRSEALTGVPPLVDGLPISSKRAQPWQGDAGAWLVDAVYEGVIEDPKPELDFYELRTEEREQKIEAFQPRDVLVEEFGAAVDPETGALSFPETLPAPASRLGQPLTLSNRGQPSPERQNPLHQTTSYGVTSSLAVWRLVRKRVPQQLARQSRTVIDRLPSGFDYDGPPASWYVRPLQKRKVGNAWEIEWSAFEVSAFPAQEVLALLQGRESAGRGAGGGLTSGSL
jgi:hypothetical protein